jgi:hypothetical protein
MALLLPEKEVIEGEELKEMVGTAPERVSTR